jgi:hypothetical protein
MYTLEIVNEKLASGKALDDGSKQVTKKGEW